MAKAGRPTLYTVELGVSIAERLSEGESLRQIVLDPAMPGRRTILTWMDVHEEFGTICARARELQADVLDEDIGDIERQTLSGEVDPAVARVVIASKQWRAERMAPKKYGSRQTVEQKISGSLDLHEVPLDQARRVAEAILHVNEPPA